MIAEYLHGLSLSRVAVLIGRLVARAAVLIGPLVAAASGSPRIESNKGGYVNLGSPLILSTILWRIALHPSIDRRMVDHKAPLAHHFFEIAVTQGIAQVPPHAQQDEFRFGLDPVSWTYSERRIRWPQIQPAHDDRDDGSRMSSRRARYG